MSLIVKAEAVIPKERKRAANQYARPETEYHWTRKDTGFELILPNNWYLSLRPIGESWEMRMKAGDDFIGTRKTLEEAFRVLDHRLHDKAKAFWLKTRCRVVISEYGGLRFDKAGDIL